MRSPLSWLDLKLGFRMLARYPGLSVVGGLAIAFAIWVAAGMFELATQVVRPALPLEEGHRIVGIRVQDLEANRTRDPSLHDLGFWREQLETVGELGGFRTQPRNLIAAGVQPGPADVAEMSAAGFRVARESPLIGRVLIDADEMPGAPPVVVMGHDLWQTRFEGDPGVVGRDIRLGNTVHTVVGVMPQGFSFPVNHELWIPLSAEGAALLPGAGPPVKVFGRLMPGASLEQAQTELTTLALRHADALPETFAHLRPRVLPYARSILDLSTFEFASMVSGNVFLVMLLVLVCGNVALLMFARAAAREREMVVRTALGASRRRIIAQLFAEALVLAGLGAALGLAAASWGLTWALGMLEGELLSGRPLPFWIRDSLSPTTVVYAGALTVVGAVVAGVIPALKVTRGLGSRLKEGAAGGGGFRFGGLWTTVIVTQVAVTVIFPAAAFLTHRDADQVRAVDAGFPAEDYLSARLALDTDAFAEAPSDSLRAALRLRVGAAARQVERRLEADPTVVGVTFAERLPRMYHPHRRIELDEGGAAPVERDFGYRRISSVGVAIDYFDVFDAPILAGRGFHPGDLGPEANVAIANESFVARVLGGRNPIGRRVRYLYYEEGGAVEPPEHGRWYEIVGVVRDMGFSSGEYDPKVAGLYHPVEPGTTSPLHMAVHVLGDPEAFAPEMAALAAEVEPDLRLHDVTRLDRVIDSELRFLGFWFWLTVVVSAVALLLSLAGIYSVMSFTVAQRTREIGIRVALGASARRIVVSIFRRPLTQVGLGIGAGAVVVGATMVLAGLFPARQLALIVAYAGVMMGVCMIACIVPTRRALGVEPTEALRADG